MAERAPAIAFHDFEPELEDFRASVLAGLAKPQKELSPKFFYDARGSALFERICDLEVYYPTRTELTILHANAGEIAALAGADPLVVEFGSGSSRKTRALLDSLGQIGGYVAIDISKDFLLRASRELAAAWPGLEIAAVCADYTRPFRLPRFRPRRAGRRLGVFFGSSIGNFTPLQAVRFLRNAGETLGSGATLIVGVDLKKDAALLNDAYNDPEGVTAEFNLNLLARINRELGADFDCAAFRHRAHYNAALGRVEMHLESLTEQTVRVSGRRFEFRAGETIHSENSYKFSVSEFREMASSAGLEPVRCWTDAQDLFSLHGLAVP